MPPRCQLLRCPQSVAARRSTADVPWPHRHATACPAAVAIAEPVYIYRVARVPNDPSYAEAHLTSGMWHLRKVRPGPLLWVEGRCWGPVS